MTHTLALARLQVVHAFGVTDPGTLRFLPGASPPEVAGLDWVAEVGSALVGYVDDICTS